MASGQVFVTVLRVKGTICGVYKVSLFLQTFICNGESESLWLQYERVSEMSGCNESFMLSPFNCSSVEESMKTTGLYVTEQISSQSEKTQKYRKRFQSFKIIFIRFYKIPSPNIELLPHSYGSPANLWKKFFYRSCLGVSVVP